MNNNNRKEVSMRRSLISTFLLMANMLYRSPKSGTPEEQFAPVAGSILDAGWEGFPLVEPHLSELVEQGYLTRELTGGYNVSAYGQKLALQATHNTPNFQRLAEAGPSTAFAMLFASTKGLEKHLAGQDRLIAGNSTQLVDNVREMIMFFAPKIGLQVTEVAAVAPKVTKKATKKELVTEEVAV